MEGNRFASTLSSSIAPLRYAQAGASGLEDRSKRPRRSPARTATEVEQAVVRLRHESRNSWGGRKLARLLARQGGPALAPSTVTGILRRAGLLDPAAAPGQRPFQRFEREAPNELWQMDFKGHFPLLSRSRCHPLTVLDDHSRFSLVLKACADERGETVRGVLTSAFRRYGLPAAMLMDNGTPWGSDHDHSFTAFSLWLIRLGIRVAHGRAYHPQTQGKDERFHRSLKVEVLAQRIFGDFERLQIRFDEWRYCYNHVRPHEALGMAVPASRYQSSPRSFPEQLPPLEYGAIDQVRKVQSDGKIFFRNREFRVGKAFRGYPVALRPTLADGVYEIYFATHRILTIDLRQPE